MKKKILAILEAILIIVAIILILNIIQNGKLKKR